jgi:hypothetical protein
MKVPPSPLWGNYYVRLTAVYTRRVPRTDGLCGKKGTGVGSPFLILIRVCPQVNFGVAALIHELRG